MDVIIAPHIGTTHSRLYENQMDYLQCGNERPIPKNYSSEPFEDVVGYGETGLKASA
jgi:hypothetical protein